MSKKIKKSKRILAELKNRKRINENYCDFNSCSPSPYMEGSNKILNEMIEFIEKLK